MTLFRTFRIRLESTPAAAWTNKYKTPWSAKAINTQPAMPISSKGSWPICRIRTTSYNRPSNTSNNSNQANISKRTKSWMSMIRFRISWSWCSCTSKMSSTSTSCWRGTNLIANNRFTRPRNATNLQLLRSSFKAPNPSRKGTGNRRKKIIWRVGASSKAVLHNQQNPIFAKVSMPTTSSPQAYMRIPKICS